MDYVWIFFLAAVLLTIPMFFIFMKQIKAGDKTVPSPSTEELYAFEAFDWGRLWVYDNGRDRESAELPLLFLHSMGASIYSWRNQIEELPQKRRVIAIDLPGFGRSDKKAELAYDLDTQTQRILAMLETKKIYRCHLIGCSLGGALALWMMAQHPNRFQKTIVISPAADPELVPRHLFRPELWIPLGKRLVSKRIVKMFLEGGLSRKDRITPEVVDNYYQPFSEPGTVECFLKSVSIIRDPRIFAALKTIAEEVLVLWGAHDRVVKKPVVDKIARELRNGRLIVHPEGGHHLMEDEADWVNDQIRAFLGST